MTPEQEKLIQEYGANEADVSTSTQLLRACYRELTQLQAKYAELSDLKTGDCSHGVHGPWCRQYKALEGLADKSVARLLKIVEVLTPNPEDPEMFEEDKSLLRDAFHRAQGLCGIAVEHPPHRFVLLPPIDESPTK